MSPDALSNIVNSVGMNCLRFLNCPKDIWLLRRIVKIKVTNFSMLSLVAYNVEALAFVAVTEFLRAGTNAD